MKIRFCFSSILLAFLLIQEGSYSQSLQFVKTFKGKLYDNPGDIAISKKGTVYVSGYYNSDTISIGNCTLYNILNKKNNIFLAKLDTMGNCFWIKTIAADSLNYQQTNIAADTLDNIYISSQFHGQIDVDPSPAFYYLNAITTCTNVFVAKYDPNGSLKWAFPILDSGVYVKDTYLEIDKEQNLLVSGLFYKTTDFDPSPNSHTLRPFLSNAPGTYLAKYDSLGNFKWVIPFMGPSGSAPGIYDIETDNDNNIVITGNTFGVIDFDPDPLQTYNLTNGGYYLAKYTSSGKLKWANGINGGSGTNLKINSHGNIYVTGHISSNNIDFDPSSSGTIVLSTHGLYDVFFAKYDSLGNIHFAKSVGGLDNEYVYDLEKDNNDNFYFIVNYWSNPWDCDFSSNVSSLNQIGGGDDVVLHTDSTGSLIDFIKIATQYTDTYCRRLGQINNTLFLLGWYNGIPVDFDPSSNYNCPLYYGGSDITLAKYGFNNNIVTSQNQISTSYDFLVYPNPANSYVSIKGINTQMIVRITDLFGQIIIEKSVDMDCEINTEKFSDGLYTITIFQNSMITSSRKLIIVSNK